MEFDPNQSPILQAQASVKESNIAKAMLDSQIAAKQEQAITPTYFNADVASASDSAVGVTWSFSGASDWQSKLPMILLFVVVMYVIFKD